MVLRLSIFKIEEANEALNLKVLPDFSLVALQGKGHSSPFSVKSPKKPQNRVFVGWLRFSGRGYESSFSKIFPNFSQNNKKT